jgi:hypothetical protein
MTPPSRTRTRTAKPKPAAPARDGGPPPAPAGDPPASPSITFADLPVEDQQRILAEAANEAKVAANPSPPTAGATVLTDEDRARIHAEVEAERQAAAASTGDARADARMRAIAGLMEPRDHARECPMLPHRTEAYTGRVPPRPQDGIPARDVTVVRCQDCGESLVVQEAYPVVMAQIETGLDAAAVAT